MFAAHQAGIKVFATGGIGGVHKESAFDVSTDLQALASIPMIVVCAGAKAILDLPATLEYLETMAVPVVGYQTEAFPAFYSRDSGLKASVKLETPDEIVKLAQAHWDMGMRSAVLVTQPVPPGMKSLKIRDGLLYPPGFTGSHQKRKARSGSDPVPAPTRQRTDRWAHLCAPTWRYY
jgi:pseudouridine-5'-phosphate glycosidase